MAEKRETQSIKRFRKASNTAYGVFLLLFLAVVFKYGMLNLGFGDYSQRKDKMFREVRIMSERGNIYSRDMRLMASTMPRYLLCIDPSFIVDSVYNRDIRALSAKLAEFFKDKSAAEYKKLIDEARMKGKEYLRLNKRWLTYDEYLYVKKFPILREKKKNALVAEERYEREFFFGSLARRTIGNLDKVSSQGTMRGLNGLEHAYDSILSGKDGCGKKVRTLNMWVRVVDEEPQNGCDLITTIDVDIQDVAEFSLRRQLEHQMAEKGVAIIMEVKTGAVRAIVNLRRNENGKYVEDYFNYAIGETIEPGSTFKLATIMACMEDGFVAPKDTINTFNGMWNIHDRVMKDSHTGGFGNVTIEEAFAKSSNIAFARMMEKYYAHTPEKFIERMNDFGLCDDLDIDLVGAAPTLMISPDKKTWSGTSLHWLATGYGVQMTPLQMVTFYNAVANGGKMMKPKFVEAIVSEGEIIKTVKPEVMRSSIASSKTIRAAHEMLKLVVKEGTASKVKDASCQIAGKTGTAQIAEGSQGYGHASNSVKHLASFAGFFPADNPMYSCIVMVYKPTRNIYGSEVSATVVKDIANRVYATEYARGNVKEKSRVNLTKSYPYSKGGRKDDMEVVFDELDISTNIDDVDAKWVSTEAKETGVKLKNRAFVGDMVPNVIGMGASDAVSLLEGMGLRVRLMGHGAVRQQSISAGSHFKVGQTIEIVLKNE